MEIVVIGGVVSATLLSLVVVPACYLAIENAKAKIRALRGQPPHSRMGAAAAAPPPPPSERASVAPLVRHKIQSNRGLCSRARY
jgi:hypothetical protein